MPPFPLTEWRPEHLRLTAFPLPGSNLPSLNWWQQVTGTEPDARNEEPKKGAAEISGSLGERKLVLSFQPERIDWRLVPLDLDPDNLGEGLEFLNIGLFPDARETFIGICQRWFAQTDLPDFGRLAVGAVLNHPEVSRDAGYGRLPEYLPVQNKDNSSDFVYQLNVPAPSGTGIEGLRINRLSKWSVVVMRRLGFQLTIGGATAAPLLQTAQPIHALRLELDINTAAGFEGALPKARLSDILGELVNCASEVASNGVRTL